MYRFGERDIGLHIGEQLGLGEVTYAGIRPPAVKAPRATKAELYLHIL
jgi:hypothetical protein